jgi:MoaD family protein
LKVKVTFLATFRDVTGTSQTIVDIKGDTVGDVMDALVMEYGDRFKNEILASDGNFRKHIKVFLNGNFIDRSAPLKNPVKEGDTLALIPPIVAG